MDSPASECEVCGFPQGGTEQQQRDYRTRMYRVSDLLEVAQKSQASILSMAYIFFFMAVVVMAFSLIFREQHFAAMVLFILVGVYYLAMRRLGRSQPYFMVLGAFFGYIGHTLLELSLGMVPAAPVPLDHSFAASKGATLFFSLIPTAYLVVRLALMFVLGRYLLTELRLRRFGKMADFARNQLTKENKE